jgi:hypothetical protein
LPIGRFADPGSAGIAHREASQTWVKLSARRSSVSLEMIALKVEHTFKNGQ